MTVISVEMDDYCFHVLFPFLARNKKQMQCQAKKCSATKESG